MGVTMRERPEGSGVWWVYINHRKRRKAKKVGDYSSAKEVAKQIRARLAVHRGRNSINYVWRRSLERAGLRYEKFHIIRHSVAANLLSAGAPINYVKELLGHASIRTTIDIYGKYIPQGGGSAVGLLDAQRRGGEGANAGTG